MRKHYLIGVDTGGTFTDAVILELGANEVLASVKALTTRHDLAIGVNEAISGVLAAFDEPITADEFALVSISTTLATNAVVEGHGGQVGMIFIGFDEAMIERSGIARAYPGMPVKSIRGGHNHNGEEAQPLDEEALIQAVGELEPRVDAFAIAGQFAVRNADHEMRAAAAIAKVSHKPVTLSTELSSRLDAPRRALTAVMNARLIGRISSLIEAVRLCLAGHNIAAPLMVVKGDGTLAAADKVIERPIETVLSGPASSLIGAAHLTGKSDLILSDMGGTTTDLAILSNNRPRISDSGAEVGGWRTMVRAIDVRTIGLGGDSEIDFAMDGKMTIGPGRVVPISLLAMRFPDIANAIEIGLGDERTANAAGDFALRLGEASEARIADLNPRQRGIYERLSERPQPLWKIAPSAGELRSLKALQRHGLVQLAGFTPSDAAHVLGKQENWSKEAAVWGALAAFRQRSQMIGHLADAEALSAEVCEQVIRLATRAVLLTGLGLEVSQTGANDLIIERVCRGENRIGLVGMSAQLAVPLVPVGGPAGVYYPEVAKRLGDQLVLPAHFHVANAVGAASGMVAQSIRLEVSGNGNGAFKVHDGKSTRAFSSGVMALAYGAQTAEERAREAALAMGVSEMQIDISMEKHYLPDAQDDEGLLQAIITAEALGRPAFS